MPSAGVCPALALVAGASCGALAILPAPHFATMLLATACGWTAWTCSRARLTVGSVMLGFFTAGLALGSEARTDALDTALRRHLDRQFGAFDIQTPGPAAPHDPLAVRAVLLEDAGLSGGVVTTRARVRALGSPAEWVRASGDVIFSIGGGVAPGRAGEWRAGRVVEAPAVFRRPARYLNDGVPDFERDLALDGTTLFASVKSGLLVDIVARGSPVQEAAGDVRSRVRATIGRRVGRHDPLSASIVTAILIGDRTGLPDDIRSRLQAAGTYHVIAISGGNIAILAAVAVALCVLFGLAGRPAAMITAIVLIGYAQVVAAGPSVWRATLMAVFYLAARMLDHRMPPPQAMAVAAAAVLCARPVDVRDVGFLLTFGATAALIDAARRTDVLRRRHAVLRWLLGSIAASVAAELVLLPIGAAVFSRVTIAGLALNLIAVPTMAAAQVGGMLAVALDSAGAIADAPGFVSHLAATALVSSARLVDIAPWLTTRVPPPSSLVIAAYYVSLATALWARGTVRAAGMAGVVVCAGAIVSGARPGLDRVPDGLLRLTVFDVGQGDAALLEFPDRSTLLVDTGGAPFGNGAFDVGARVVAPALWARGVRSLGALLVTHGDPDHIGGARSVLSDFAPGQLWEGIPVPRDVRMRELRDLAVGRGSRVRELHQSDAFQFGAARIIVLHPPPADWERQRVRNADSVVLEVVYGDTAVLLTGDIDAATERTILPRLTPVRTRILKVAHHGSRTSTSGELLAAWRPQIATISAGRGNTFGHPAPEVLARLASVGARVYRTDLDGQITIETDGTVVRVRTYVGGRE